MERYKDLSLFLIAGLIVGSITLIAARYFAPPPVRAIWAVIGAALAGVLFEATMHYENAQGDKLPRSYMALNVAATAAGGLLVAILYALHNR